MQPGCCMQPMLARTANHWHLDLVLWKSSDFPLENVLVVVAVISYFQHAPTQLGFKGISHTAPNSKQTTLTARNFQLCDMENRKISTSRLPFSHSKTTGKTTIRNTNRTQNKMKQKQKKPALGTSSPSKKTNQCCNAGWTSSLKLKQRALDMSHRGEGKWH